MALTWMFGLCAILMAQLTQHIIHCDTQETADVQAATADPQMLIQMTNNFASILESLTKISPANNQYNVEMLNSMMAQQLQQPMDQTYAGRPVNPNVGVGRPGNPNVGSGRPVNPNVGSGRPVNPNVGSGRPGNPNVGSGRPVNPNYNPFGPQNPSNPQRPTNPNNPNIPQRPQSPGGRNPPITPIPLNPRDCNDVTYHAQSSNTAANIGNGVYMLTPQIFPVAQQNRDVQAFAAFCDMQTDGGNWTVIQRRSGPIVGFYRTWVEYKAGFGFLDGDHWLGLERLHQMTVHNRYELRVDLEDFQGNRVYAQYDDFKIGDESTGYMLILGAYTGTAKDSLTYHNGKPFTTKDKDHDAHKGSCAKDYKGAWWYGNCHYSNLNGIYQTRAVNNDVGMTWYAWKKRHVSLKKSEMKIRRVDVVPALL